MNKNLLLPLIIIINNIELKRESRDIDLTWFDNVPTFTERLLYFFINNLGLYHRTITL